MLSFLMSALLVIINIGHYSLNKRKNFFYDEQDFYAKF